MLFDLCVHHVGCKSFHGQVELVLPKVVGKVLHEVVGPAGVACTANPLVVLDCNQAILEDLRVEKGVKGVLADRQSIDLLRDDSTVLLLSQILYRKRMQLR